MNAVQPKDAPESSLRLTFWAAAVVGAVWTGAYVAGILKTVVLISTIFALLLTLVAIAEGGRPKLTFRAYAFIGLISAMVSAVLTGLLIFLLLSIPTVAGGVGYLVGWLQTAQSTKPLMISGVALATAAIGGAFFLFRLHQRFLYGATEALAGVMVAAHRFSQEPGTGLPSETGFYFAILTAGVYLVVRGLDNMHQALKSKNPPPIHKWIHRLQQVSERRAGKSAKP